MNLIYYHLHETKRDGGTHFHKIKTRFETEANGLLTGGCGHCSSI